MCADVTLKRYQYSPLAKSRLAAQVQQLIYQRDLFGRFFLQDQLAEAINCVHLGPGSEAIPLLMLEVTPVIDSPLN